MALTHSNEGAGTFDGVTATVLQPRKSLERLAAAVLSNSTHDGTLLDSLAYEHTCTLGLFKASRKNLKLKNIERSTLDGHSVRRQA